MRNIQLTKKSPYLEMTFEDESLGLLQDTWNQAGCL
jgi:hypothetical protein